MLDPLTVDGLAYDPEENAVIMLLSDALDWDDELTHLRLLQDKLNAYAAFVEKKQYEKAYPDIQPDHTVIELMFSGPITEKCWEFIQAAGAQLGDELGIVISVSTDK